MNVMNTKAGVGMSHHRNPLVAGREAVNTALKTGNTVNGLPAFRMVTKVRTNKGIIEIMSCFIQEGARVYEFHGLAPETRFQGYSRIFENTMERFKRITDQRKLSVKPDRIRVVRSPRRLSENGYFPQFLRQAQI